MNNFTACVPFLILALILLLASWAALLLKPKPRYPFYLGRQVEVLNFDNTKNWAKVRFEDDNTIATTTITSLRYYSE